MKVTTFVVAASLVLGCHHIPDRVAYQDEVSYVELRLESQANLLAVFLENHCLCDDGRWVDAACEEAAESVLAVRYGLGWHIGMLLYQGGLADNPPAGESPEVSDPGVLCPDEPE